MQGVYRDHGAHCALVFDQGLKWLSYIAHTSSGPKIFKARIDEFKKDFRAMPGYEFRDSAIKYLGAAKRAYEHDANVINQLLEILMHKQATEMSVTELTAAYNDIAKGLGLKPRKSFKSKAEGLKALADLDKKAKDATPAQKEVATTKQEKAAKAKAAKPATEPKEKKPRGSGIGAFCLELIAKGKSNGEVLEAVKAKFPGAKTSAGCIAFYRNKAKG